MAIAATRFQQRTRHPGHLDRVTPYPDVVASLRALTMLPPIAGGTRIDVDTSREPDLNDLLVAIQDALGLS
jgi:hypothetical protein